jgi:tetratricopeptide (TPR) repeat protein
LKGTLFSSDGNFSEPLFVISRNNDKDLVIRIPLSDRRLNGLFTVGKTSQYICVGGWTPYGRDGYVPVALRASAGIGGGAPSSLTPKIFDYLAPESRTQEEMLSAWNDDTLEIPVMFPVTVSMRSNNSRGQMNIKADSAQIEKLTALAAAESEDAGSAAAQALVTCADTGSFEYAELQFRAGKTKEAEASFDRILSVEPANAKALAYKGSLVALRGSDAPPLAAVDIIAEAYRYMDRAVSLAKQGDEILTARFNRANVSKAVPDLVFGKAVDGAGDFLAAAAEYRALSGEKNSYSREIASAYLNAALCFEIGGKNDDAGSWFREAARIVRTADASHSSGIPASLRLELVKRGYLEY